MPPKKSKGNKSKSGNEPKTRKLEDIAKAEKFESYGYVTKALGNKRFKVDINDTQGQRKSMVCALKGSCRKFVTVESYVLVVLYDFNEDQGQIVDVYTDSEVQSLKKANLWDFDDPVVAVVEPSTDTDLPEDDQREDDDSDIDNI